MMRRSRWVILQKMDTAGARPFLASFSNCSLRILLIFLNLLLFSSLPFRKIFYSKWETVTQILSRKVWMCHDCYTYQSCIIVNDIIFSLPFGIPHGGLVRTLSKKSKSYSRAGGKVRPTWHVTFVTFSNSSVTMRPLMICNTGFILLIVYISLVFLPFVVFFFQFTMEVT